MRKRLAIAAIVVGTLLALAPLAANRAATRPPMSAGPGRTATASFPAIVGNEPNGLGETPSDCDSYPWCDDIPFTIDPETNLGLRDEWTADITFSYATVNAGTELPIMTIEAFDSKTGSPLGGAGGTATSTFSLFEPTEHQYWFVVRNAAGANTGGYQISISLSVHQLDPIFQGVTTEPPLPPTEEPRVPPAAATTPTTRGAPGGGVSVPTTPATVPPVASRPVTEDADLASVAAGHTDLDQALLAPPTIVQAAAIRAPAPAPGVPATLAWILGIPLVLGGTGYLLGRRYRSAPLE